MVDLVANIQCHLNRVIDQPIAFQLHLTACQIQRGNQLLVRAGSGMGKDGFVQLRLNRLKVHILDQHHGALANG